MKYTYVDPNTFDVIDAIRIDTVLYPILKVLHDKGYKVLDSSSGDIDNSLLETDVVDIHNIKEDVVYNKSHNLCMTYNRNKKFDYIIKQKYYTCIYISFDDKYEFDILPQGFELASIVYSYKENNNIFIDNKTSIRCYIPLYNDIFDYTLHKRRDTEQVEMELDNYRYKLLMWACYLPKKENERKRENKI